MKGAKADGIVRFIKDIHAGSWGGQLFYTRGQMRGCTNSRVGDTGFPAESMK
jgi:hypothetical protein